MTSALLGMVQAKARQRNALEELLEERLAAWWRMTDPYDDDQIAYFTEQAIPLMETAQQAIVSLTTAGQMMYMQELGVDLNGFVPDVPPEVRTFPHGVVGQFGKPVQVSANGRRSERLAVSEPFQRPARQLRAEVAEGKPFDNALAKSAERVKIIAGTNLALAAREAEMQIMQEAKRQNSTVIGYRRVIHPEFSVSGSCGLCVAASDRIYTVKDLKAIHTHCHCETMAVTRTDDPGRDLNENDLKSLYQDATSTYASDLKRTRYKVDSHGELQAVLVPKKRGQDVLRTKAYTAPPDLDEFQRQYEIAQRQLPLFRKILAQTRADGFDDNSNPVKYQTAQIARFEGILSGNK
ncbi:hypothetical protein ACFRAQ_35055 [Nocardia sp. NPDC056611]|uniref:hypothetical protein n=1 Tax=Nocardia sp. NPDC056611 TaxID=3345877 RepID=UPI00366C4E3E